MPVVPFAQPRAPGPRAMPDPTFVMAAVADLHTAGMLVAPETNSTSTPAAKASDEPNGRG